MSNTYTFEDVQYLFPEPTTPEVESAIVLYLNEGTVPPADPCQGCTPNLIRRYIGRVQAAERNGTWPPKAEKPFEFESGVLLGGRDDLDFTDSPIKAPETPKPKPRTKGK